MAEYSFGENICSLHLISRCCLSLEDKTRFRPGCTNLSRPVDSSSSDASTSNMSFLHLPYDIREQIYLQLFPHTPNIYLHATDDGVVHLPQDRDSGIPTAYLRTCKALHREASEYLYNGYIFDIVGKKKDCVFQHQRLKKTVEKYARNEVHTRALSNGLDSWTGCISIFAGDAKLAISERRQRGQPATIEELAREEEMKLDTIQRANRRTARDARVWWWTRFVAGLILGFLCGWYLGGGSFTILGRRATALFQSRASNCCA